MHEACRPAGSVAVYVMSVFPTSNWCGEDVISSGWTVRLWSLPELSVGLGTLHNTVAKASFAFVGVVISWGQLISGSCVSARRTEDITLYTYPYAAVDLTRAVLLLNYSVPVLFHTSSFVRDVSEFKHWVRSSCHVSHIFIGHNILFLSYYPYLICSALFLTYTLARFVNG